MAGSKPDPDLLLPDEALLFKPLSGASLGLDPCLPDTHATYCAFDAPARERYSEGGVLGRGGMGEIRAAFDARLQRTTALKTPLSASPDAQDRLVQEAILTARLAHPGIVPIYDAGRTPDGKPYYTMPVLREQSLETAIQGASLATRLRLVPRLLTACQAVAYAHAQGLVHRDLKPANILVGPFGETLVADWGLAAPSGAPGTGPSGTPGYAPPEQVSGVPIHPTLDVYALGMTLRQLCTGMPPGQASSQAEVHAIPPDLLAIVTRATQAQSSARYPDAAHLAQDLEAWFEGRRVKAHRYTLRELIQRIWQQHRLSVSIGGIAFLLVALVLARSAQQTRLEHDATRAAQQHAVEALERSDRHLSLAELAQALEAINRNAWGDAELLAASSLVLEESPEARGVLTRLDPRARPRLLQQWALPKCVRQSFTFGGGQLVCSSGEEVSVITPDGLEQLVHVPHYQAVAVGAGEVLLTDTAGLQVELIWMDGSQRRRNLGALSVPRLFPSASDAGATWIGGNQEHWLDMDSGEVLTTEWCVQKGKSIPAVTSISQSGLRITVCQNGAILIGQGDLTPETPLMHLGSERGTPQSLVFSASDDRTVALGLASGSVGILDLRSGTVIRWFERESGALLDLALVGSRLALSDGKRTVLVLDVQSGALLTRIDARRARVAWRDGGRVLRVSGDVLGDWQMPESLPWPHTREGTSGISALAFSPDGRLLASTHGDGHVRLWHPSSQTPLADLALHWSVAKDAEFSPDSQSLGVVSAQSQTLYLLHIPPLEPSGTEWRFQTPPKVEAIPAVAGRRVTWLREDRLLSATYKGGLLAWQAGTSIPSPIPVGDISIFELEAAPDRSGMTLLGSDGQVQWLPTTSEIPAWRRETLTAIAVAGNGRQTLLLHELALELLDLSGESRRVELPEGMATEVALDPRGRWAAVGHHNGTLSIWALPELELRAVLRGHEGRVAALAFHPQEDWLFSGSWDGDIRAWSLHPLETSSHVLLEEAVTTWGRTVEDVLRARSGLQE